LQHVTIDVIASDGVVLFTPLSDGHADGHGAPAGSASEFDDRSHGQYTSAFPL